MVSEEKLRLLTKTAVIEKNSREQFNINNYFRRDYIVYHMLLIWICVTIAFLAVVFGVVAYYIEQAPEVVQEMNYAVAGLTVLMIYIIVAVFYAIISAIVYSMRYDKAVGVVKKYNNSLKLIEKEYEKEDERKKAVSSAGKVSEDTLVKKRNAVKRKGEKA